MGRIISIVLFVLVIGYVFTIATTYHENVAFEAALQRIPVIDEINTTLGSFNKTGTLVFYPNNVGPVPYLFYQDERGRTVAKALVFPNSSPVNFSSWSGAHISITGEVNGEHVVVSNITFISAP